MKKTKIIATIGPASQKEEILEQMMLGGMDIARINMTHANHTFCKDIVHKIHQLNQKLNKNTSIMFDLNGPNITVGKFIGGKAYFHQNDKIRIYDQEIMGNDTKFSVSYPHLIKEVKQGSIIKINDGLIELEVIQQNHDHLMCRVIKEGPVLDGKGLNVINTKLEIPFLNEKDKQDIKLACALNIDFLALSFVSSYEDIIQINDLLIEQDNDHIAIIPKIENESALEDIDDILKISDGIMIARGDLGVEIPMERIPGIQNMIIHKCHAVGKINIVATEMMSTMEQASRPTRAEVSDVATAVIEGVDVVMLSGETTLGRYPVETVQMMSKIVESVEQDVDYVAFLNKTMRAVKQDITSGVAYSVVDCSNRLKCDLIITPTMSGYTAKKISHFHPKAIIVALSPDINVVKELNIYYGVYPIFIEDLKSFDEMMMKAQEIARSILKEKKGKIIITGGYPFREVKHTNFMKIEEL